MRNHLACLFALAALASGCNQDKTPATPGGGAVAQPRSAEAPGEARPGSGAAVERGARAEIGKAAPDFTLKDLDGTDHKLSSYKGKVVVLEWFNPGCPFVKNAHSKGSLKDAARRHTASGVVWLGVNSGAPGKQGHGVDANREARRTYSLEHPILLDETGVVGRAYGATNTPHMMVIDEKGALVYRGAVDNSPDGEGESPTGGKLVSYVDAALAELAAGKPVSTPETQAYGCSVKYAK